MLNKSDKDRVERMGPGFRILVEEMEKLEKKIDKLNTQPVIKTSTVKEKKE